MKTNMIKQRIVALGLAYSMVFIGGCTSNSEQKQEGQNLQVEAVIISPSTRAFDGTNYDQKKFVENDEIGINKGDNMDAAQARTYVRSSKWVPKTDRWEVTGVAGETFSAYYPLAYTGILPDQSTPTSFWQSNLLKANGATPQGNVATFAFHPAHSKITLNITYIDSETPTSATISGTEIITIGGGEGQISLYRTSVGTSASKKHSYTGIVNSVNASFTIKVITTPGGEKTYAHTTTNYLPGHNYIFNFTSKDDLILNGMTVSSFTSTGETEAGSAM